MKTRLLFFFLFLTTYIPNFTFANALQTERERLLNGRLTLAFIATYFPKDYLNLKTLERSLKNSSYATKHIFLKSVLPGLALTFFTPEEYFWAAFTSYVLLFSSYQSFSFTKQKIQEKNKKKTRKKSEKKYAKFIKNLSLALRNWPNSKKSAYITFVFSKKYKKLAL